MELVVSNSVIIENYPIYAQFPGEFSGAFRQPFSPLCFFIGLDLLPD